MEGTTLSNDFLGNLAKLTQSLHEIKADSNSAVDLTGIEAIPDIIPEAEVVEVEESGVERYFPKETKFGSVETNIPDPKFTATIEIENKEEERKKETERLLNINHDPHGDFKVDVKELAKIEDLVKEYSVLIKKLREKKEHLKKKTITHMVEHEIDVAQMSETDKYSLMTVKRKVNPTTKTRLPENLKMYFIEEENMVPSKAEKKAIKINDWIHKNAETKIDQSLRRYRKKN